MKQKRVEQRKQLQIKSKMAEIKMARNPNKGQFCCLELSAEPASMVRSLFIVALLLDAAGMVGAGASPSESSLHPLDSSAQLIFLATFGFALGAAFGTGAASAVGFDVAFSSGLELAVGEDLGEGLGEDLGGPAALPSFWLGACLL